MRLRFPRPPATPALARAFCVVAALCLPLPLFAAQTQIVAYRGGAGLYPENTREAFAHALSVGVDALHVTVAVTADDVPVAIHDLNLDGDLTRGLGGAWLGGYEPAIIHFTFRELQDFDVGRANPNSADHRRHPERTPIDGTAPIALAELFQILRRARNKTVDLYVEALDSPFQRALTPRPRDYAERLTQTLGTGRGMARTVLLSRDWTLLRVAELLEPELRTGCVTIETKWLDTVRRNEDHPSPWLGGIDVDDYPSLPAAVQASGCTLWAPHVEGVSAEEVARARELGLRVALWPVDAPGAMTLWMDQGVDALMTDRPDVLRGVLVERGLAPPPRTRVR